MNIGSLGCRRISKSEEKELMICLNQKVSEYTVENIDYSFNSISEIYTYCKKNKITEGKITHNLGYWGDVKSLVNQTKKQILAKFD